ncbi:MAG: M14 family metallopeptidase [Pirellulaceae bacterium]
MLLMAGVGSVFAGPKQERYQAMGAPSDPQVPARWNRYHDYSEATALLKRLASVHSQRARLRSLGESYGGREMWLLTITNFETGDDRGKPAFWIDGGIHANEVQGAQVTLYTAWYLLEMYGRHDAVTRLVDERTFYLVPMMSPDSRDAHMYEPNTTHSPRSGQRPVDDDRDGLVDEDGYDDLDGDGHITQMRRRDPNGRWKAHPDYPQLMIRAEPDERGEYELLGREGFDNDGDGRVNEDGDGYYDPNRDWPWRWQPNYVQRGAHHYPLSIGENRVVADFVVDHPNVAGAQSYHNSGGMILRGPGDEGDHYSSRDVAVYDAIAKKGEQMLPAYDYLTCSTGLYNVRGGEFDWLFSMRGVFSFTNELFTLEHYFRRKLKDRGEGERKFNELLLLEQGTIPWHEVDHPQYGRIEVGGTRKEWGRQPPSFLLEEECHRNMAFTLYHADQMPQVAVQSVEIKRLDNKLVQVSATIINEKLIPTRAQADVRNNITPPDVVSIRGRKLNVITALRSDEPFFENATELQHKPGDVEIPRIPGMGAIHVRWFVEGSAPYTVKIQSVKGGSDRVRKQ